METVAGQRDNKYDGFRFAESLLSAPTDLGTMGHLNQVDAGTDDPREFTSQ
jgi:hypothetical protein